MSINDLKRDWEDMAELDPLWAILSVPDKKFGKWNIDEFFLTGIREIERILKEGARLGYPLKHEKALDFGCGVGRLTRALADKFTECYGVDISEKMIKKALELNGHIANCKFIVNESDNLRIFQDNYFDLIYTSIVLQHISDIEITKSYISEFIRVLDKDGLLVFQLPSYIPPERRIQTGAKEFSELRKKGVDARFLYEVRKLNPIRMNFVPEDDVIAILKKKGAKILEIQKDLMAGSELDSRIYYVTK